MTIGRDPFTDLHPIVRHHIVNTLGWSALRPLQADSITPLSLGEDALLLAPTAGGKTEAAMFPLLTRMENQGWRGLSVLYVCPIKALLNNLESRLADYAGWLGRRVSIRHGDTPEGVRTRDVVDPPDILLTTPESIEAALVSRKVDAESLFSGVRAVVVDELHAFAGDDRGWHLLAVLERLAAISGVRVQRVGLSATVGNAPDLLEWLQAGSGGSTRGRVIAPGVELSPASPHSDGKLAHCTEGVHVGLDYVGSVPNAATVIAALHRGEKRLVFADSRKLVEELAMHLRSAGVTVFVSHSSVSLDERSRAEEAFAQARDCVIVATSTLELGIDVGDLDRVIQVGAASSVASMLQRLGRTGRRTGSLRNMLFMAITGNQLLQACGLLRLWESGFVEPVIAPNNPYHVVSQQLLGMVLQQGRIDRNCWFHTLMRAGLLERGDSGTRLAQGIAEWMVSSGYLVDDGGLLELGGQSEKAFGARHYMDAMAVFSTPPQFTVQHGRQEVGLVDPIVFAQKADGPLRLTLAGAMWRVEHIDWRRQRVHVTPDEVGGKMRWTGGAIAHSFELMQAQREVLLGEDLRAVDVSQRALTALARVRGERVATVAKGCTVLEGEDSGIIGQRWFTYAGLRANLTLRQACTDTGFAVFDEERLAANEYLVCNEGVSAPELTAALRAAHVAGFEATYPIPEEGAVRGLKFSEMLPPELAQREVSSRLQAADEARKIAIEPIINLGDCS